MAIQTPVANACRTATTTTSQAIPVGAAPKASRPSPGTGTRRSATSRTSAAIPAKPVASRTTGGARGASSPAVRNGARNLVSTSTGEARQRARQLLAEGRELLDDASVQVREQVDEQSDKVVDGIRRLGAQLLALADGDPHGAGPFDDYARDIADRLYTFASDIEAEGVQGLLREIEGVARRRPGLFVLGAAALGVGAGRLVRASTADDKSAQRALPPSRQSYEAGYAPAGGR